MRRCQRRSGQAQNRRALVPVGRLLSLVPEGEWGGEGIAVTSTAWADEAAWATDISSLVLVLRPVGKAEVLSGAL